MIELGLQRISRLLAGSSLPWRAIHVAGTNGKGSICAYVSAMLDVYNSSPLRSQTQKSEIRHGRYTSPHLIDRWDCITINQETISSSIFNEVEKKVLERNKREEIKPSEFEVLTATAFEIFTTEQVDIGVVEVGLGGRLDATNILGQPDTSSFRAPPLVTAVSKIGLDHQDFLGDTLEDIAREKAGIIKPGVPVVYDRSNERQVVDVIEKTAHEKGCSVLPAGASLDLGDNGSALDISKVFNENVDGKSSTHRSSNLAVALWSTWTTLRQLDRLGAHHPKMQDMQRELANEMIRAAEKMTFPGRQQRINIENLTGRKQDVLLDGAHNAQSAIALAGAVEKLRDEANGQQSNVTWLLAASSSKDVTQILSPLLKNDDAAFAVEFGPVDGMPWVKPLPASSILDAARRVLSEPETLYTRDCGLDIVSALDAATQRAAGGPLVIAGSLYLVGDVLRLLRDKQP